jgi:hypothetical protein
LSDESARPDQRHLEIIDPEKQKQTVARGRVIGTHQGRMLMVTPAVKAEQDCSFLVENLAKEVMGGRRLRQTK